ncbi:MAG TPA: AtpZ/AtpI family protein [Polyangia bacterium]
MDPEAKKMWGIAASTGAVGLEIAAAIGIGYLGGQYLDRKLGVAPWFMWVGFAAGVGAGIKALVRVVRNYKKTLAEEAAEEAAAEEDRSDPK